MAQPKDEYDKVAAWLKEIELRKIGKSAALGMGYGGSMQGAYAQAETRRWAHNMAQNESNETRFRSFAERYVIARAPSFRYGHEEEDQWTCLLNAKSAYRKIEAMGRGITNEDEKLAQEMGPGQPTQGQNNAAGASVTGRLSNPEQSPMLQNIQRSRMEADSKSWTGYGYRGGKYGKRK